MKLSEKFELLGMLEVLGDFYTEKYEEENNEDRKEKRREVLKLLGSEEKKQMYWESLERDFGDFQRNIVYDFTDKIKEEILKELN